MSYVRMDCRSGARGRPCAHYLLVEIDPCAAVIRGVPIALVPNATVIAAGDKLSFYLMLRNDGNCFLSGVELSVAEVGQEPFGTIRLDFSEENTLESEWNPLGDDGKLQGVEDDWVLAPGMSARYCAEYVTTPETWEGDKQIEVFVSAVYTAGSGGLSTQAEDDSIEYIPDQRARSVLSMDGGTTSVECAGNYSPSDVTVTKGDSGESGTGDDGRQTSPNRNAGTSAASPSTGTSSSRSALPSTGDALFLAAAAAVGASSVAARKILSSLERSGKASPRADALPGDGRSDDGES